MRPVVVIGHGLIGGALGRRLAGDGVPVISVAQSSGTLRCDLTTPGGRALMLAAVRGAQPGAIVLAHGPSDETWCERAPEAARAAHEGIAATVSGIGVPVILISTDNVFDGSRPCRVVTDPVLPQNAYGRAKLAAEQAVLAESGHVVLRVSPVYGPSDGRHRTNFAQDCLRAARAGEPLRVPFDQAFTPVHVADVARVAAAVALAPAGAPPLAHVAGPDQLTGADPGLVEGVPRAITHWASRPAHSSLAGTDLQAVPGLRDYQPMTARQGLEQMTREDPKRSRVHAAPRSRMEAHFGADAGGTRTRLVVSRPDGGERAARYPSLNPAAIGPEAAAAALAEMFGFIRGQAGGAPVSGWLATASVSPGTAGEQLGLIAAAAERAGVRGRLRVSGDLLPLLLAPPLGGVGSVVVIGTGSCALAGDGRQVRTAGGHEYLGSDQGSAFDLGLAGLRAACQALDGTAAPTALTAGLAAVLGGDPRAAARRLALRPFPKQPVAALAPAVCSAWTGGDKVARQIVAVAIAQLARTAAALRQAAGTPTDAGSVLTGGVLTGCPEFAADLAAALCRCAGPHPVTVAPDASAAALALAAQPPLGAPEAAALWWPLQLGAALVPSRAEAVA
jgi:N-acetylglucosamine kinase-like BadF-type ATPase/dTDP-4-dehydrorhamnose reductase